VPEKDVCHVWAVVFSIHNHHQRVTFLNILFHRLLPKRPGFVVVFCQFDQLGRVCAPVVGNFHARARWMSHPFLF